MKKKSTFLIRIGGLPYDALSGCGLPVALWAAMQTADTNTQAGFDAAMLGIRAHLQTLAQHPNLQKGLVLSSPVLLAQVQRFLQKEPSSFRKKERQTERAVLQYLTRMTAKTSPFSTFNQLALLELNDAPIFFDKVQLCDSQSIITVNMELLAALKSKIWEEEALRQGLRLRLNPTSENRGAAFYFFRYKNNVEAFQRLAVNSVLEEILGFFVKNKFINYAILIEKLGEKVAATPAELSDFVAKLVEIGWLLVDFEIEAQQMWILPFLKRLKCLPQTPKNEAMQAHLMDLQIDLLRYANADAAERVAILTKVLGRWELFLKKRKENEKTATKISESPAKTAAFLDIKKTKKNNWTTANFFYEDYIGRLQGSASEAEVSSILAVLKGLFLALEPVEQHPKKSALLAFFKATFTQKSVPVLAFHQAYLTWQKTHKTADFAQPHRQIIKDWQAILKEKIKENIAKNGKENRIEKNVESVAVSVEMLLQTNEIMGLKASKAVKHYAAFVQFYRKEGELKGVLQASMPAYGKYFSRFLHLFPDAVTEAIRAENETQAGQMLWATLQDATTFNANVHPPLMPFEIVLPSSNEQLPEARQISVADIAVSEENGVLFLVHQKTGERIMPFDLGFQSIEGRSLLYQLLNEFTLAAFPSPHLITNAVNDLFYQKNIKEVAIYPRIVLSKKVVLQRKTWLVPKGKLPQPPQKNESEWAFYKRMLGWRKSCGLPKVCFYTITPRELTSNKANVRLSNDYKPQYLDFQNPILVQLFGRHCQRAITAVKIEEMLPAPEQLLRINDLQYATECFVRL